MPVISVESLEKFNEYLTNENNIHDKDYVLVDFYATWCGPCIRFAPTLEELSNKYTTVCFLKVDIDTIPEVVEKYDLASMPTFIVFDNKKTESIYQPLIGANKEALEAKLDLILKPQVAITEDF